MPNVTILETFISDDPSTQRYIEKEDDKSIYTNVENNVATAFHTPVYHVKSKTKHSLEKSLIKDLEILEPQDDEGRPLLDYVFANTSTLGKIMRPEMGKIYTSDKKYLNDTKKFLKVLSLEEFKTFENIDTVEEIFQLWKDFKSEKKSNFLDKYYYVEWEKFSFLNENEMFLQILSMYNLASPIMALLVPVFMSVIPFIVIKMRGIPITLEVYFTIFKDVARNHVLGRLFTNLNDMDWQQRITIIISAGIYLMSLYQNTQICIKFYKNMYKIHDILFKFSKFMRGSISRMNTFLSYTQKLSSYKKFNTTLMNNIEIMTKITDEIDEIHPFCLSYKKISDMGLVLQRFYSLYNDEEYNKAISFAFGFEGYMLNMCGIKKNIMEGVMKYGKITSKGNKSGLKLKKAMYPPLSKDHPIVNDITIKKDAIITGPNASGKTTILKTAMTNIILTQQYGCGFYKDATISPYHVFHCYLNIPDTSGRDSLFQSESRKCKQILEKIDKQSQDIRHFCLFDELYSGTNPKEAVRCGYAYLNNLSDKINVQYMLTTHYNELCEKLDKHENIVNFKMNVDVDDKKRFRYKYTIKKGINQLDGGVEVLRQMNYPEHLLKEMN